VTGASTGSAAGSLLHAQIRETACCSPSYAADNEYLGQRVLPRDVIVRECAAV
jgi:hypothetical protein